MQTGVLKLKLRSLNNNKATRLLSLSEIFTVCVRFHWGRIETLKTTNTTVIHRDCYREARELFHLPASTIQQARDKAVAAYRAHLERKKRDRRSNPPTFRRTLPLRLAAENLRIFPDKSVVRITTPDGFLWLPVLIPSCFAERVKLPHGVSELVRKGDDWFLMLAVKSPDVPVPDRERPHFGLDLGLAQLAVLAGPGVAKFFDGKPLRYTRSRYFRYRQALQAKRKVGMVKRSKGREYLWATNHNHKVSREIVDTVAKASGILHVENLTGIRERCKGTAKINRMLSGWTFAQLLQFITYKAAACGVTVIAEDPRHTSQRCSRCGHTERGNRTKQAAFACKACGYRLNADLNAARNLAARGACPSGVGGVTPPGRSGAESGEPKVARLSRHRGNRNLASSS
ncbi:transposase, IS605 OrfB family, central region [Singulisphaera sp. GP187]|uniref:RNA-guided endonuclease InsQ/TnpB family protein n=1 Tax=Singulisphaera sp. GP187 TaxID=1882752 RepID=UPI000929E342|nr:RNA-guided endonuclease TnpB family protein [Singulisphaera sp. GP187]SIO20735.1 transposase, IS605 OrfB family, central region [Singulisphaera sp. GP187]